VPLARVGDVELCYESFGSEADPAVLLIHGLGGQLLSWDESFCRRLVAGGYRVIRFDQRDGGLSSQIEAPKVPIRALMAAAAAGEPVRVPYDLTALAADAAGLLDALASPRAHVVGLSMGGMVAQTMAIRFPGRVDSMTSIMSSPRHISVDDIKASGVRAALMTAPPLDRNGAIQFFVAAHEALSGGGPFDEPAVRSQTTAAIDRAFTPAGTGRQFAAIVASGDRTEDLHAVEAPTLVLHGSLDPLIDISEGRATAAAIPGARFVPIAGMGHQAPFPIEFGAGIAATILRFLG
jgi:pimeloyl-ACP methyl ester carboxylesterase